MVQQNRFQKTEIKYLEQNRIQAVDFLSDAFLDMVRQWQAQGKMRTNIDAKKIMMIFAAIVHVDTHKQEIGLGCFPQLHEQMTNLIMQRLTHSD